MNSSEVGKKNDAVGRHRLYRNDAGSTEILSTLRACQTGFQSSFPDQRDVQKVNREPRLGIPLSGTIHPCVEQTMDIEIHFQQFHGRILSIFFWEGAFLFQGSWSCWRTIYVTLCHSMASFQDKLNVNRPFVLIGSLKSNNRSGCTHFHIIMRDQLIRHQLIIYACQSGFISYLPPSPMQLIA